MSGGGEVEVEVEGEVGGEGADPLALKEVGGVGEGGVEVEVVERSSIEEVETFCAEVDVVDVRVRGGASSPTAVHSDGSSPYAVWFSAQTHGDPALARDICIGPYDHPGITCAYYIEKACEHTYKRLGRAR